MSTGNLPLVGSGGCCTGTVALTVGPQEGRADTAACCTDTVEPAARPQEVRTEAARCCTGPAAAGGMAEVTALTEEIGVLAHPVRLRLLAELAASGGSVCVCDLERAVPVKQPTVSHHLRLLREAGLVESEKRGQWAHYALRAGELKRLRARLDEGLDRVLARGGAVAGESAGRPGRSTTRETRMAVPVLRPAAAADAGAVLALVETAQLPTAGIEAGLAHDYVVADAGGSVVGGAGLEVHGPYGLLRSVAVAPEWQGAGLGAALVRERMERAAALGLESVYLLTTTAAAWFPRLGFVPVERASVPAAVAASPEFSEICPAGAVVLAARPSAAAGAELKAQVRQKYGEAALAVRSGGSASCCGGGGEVWNPITSDLYAQAEAAAVPAEAMLASLGCGNPTALAELREGQTVLDLGSGGGIDVLLSARRVGPSGKAYGLDMTDEMLELARSNQAKAGAENVEFLKGDIEAIPLPDASVDVIISNCVINLAADKGRVIREAFRVLRPGGHLAISDIVARRDVPEELRGSMALWVGCIAGALHEAEYARLLAEAGFAQVSLEPTRVYRREDARQFLEGAELGSPETVAEVDALDGVFASAFIRAVKPA
jgi:arsenite methyltransferase